MKSNFFISLIIACCLSSCHSAKTKNPKTAIKNPNSLNIKLVNGSWFNGKAFENKIAWVSEGVLSFKNNNKENDTITRRI